MKSVVVLVILIGLTGFFGNIFLTKQLFKDQGLWIPVAFGAPAGEKMQLQIAVSPMMSVKDPPEKNEHGTLKWKEWITSHFQLYDQSNKLVPLSRMGTSALMLDDRAAGSPDFVLWADLNKGEKAAFDFVPIIREGKRYRYEFTVPDEPEKVGLKTFAFVEDEG